MTATHLADTSVLVRLHHDDVVARVGPLLVAGQVATTGIVDLELLRRARRAADHEAIRTERRLLPRVPVDDAVIDRAVEVQGLLADGSDHRTVALTALLVAAAAERAGLVVLHYAPDVARVAAVTGQPAEWVVPWGSMP